MAGCAICLFCLLLTNGFFVSLSLQETQEGKENSRREMTPEIIKKLLEFIQDNFEDGYSFEDIAYYSDEYGIDLKVKVPYLNVSNIGKFDIRNTSANNEEMQIGAAVSFAVLNATGNYSLGADSQFFYFFGNGSCSANAAGIDVAVNLTFKENENNELRLAEAHLDYNVSAVQVWLDNLLDGCKVGKDVNEIINIALPEVIKVAKPTALTFLKDFTNDQLMFFGMDWDQLVQNLWDLLYPST